MGMIMISPRYFLYLLYSAKCCVGRLLGMMGWFVVWGCCFVDIWPILPVSLIGLFISVCMFEDDPRGFLACVTFPLIQWVFTYVWRWDGCFLVTFFPHPLGGHFPFHFPYLPLGLGSYTLA